MKNYSENGSKTYLMCIVFVAILGGLLFGYDTAVISGAEQALAIHFNISGFIHGFTASSALIGCVLGSAISGFFATRLGRRDSMRVAAVLFIICSLGTYLPEFLIASRGDGSTSVLIAFNVYRIIGGMGIGLASAIVPMYIAEIAPSEIRGKLVSCNQFAIIFGMLVVYFVNYAIKLQGDQAWLIDTGWRYMFLTGIIPAVVFFILLFFVPRSPRYLVMTHYEGKALDVLTKINGKKKALEILESIKNTSKERTEKLFTFGVKVIVIGILLSVFQQAIGINAVLYYAPRIFEGLGAGDSDMSMIQTVVMGFVNIVFTLIAIFTVEKMGRKPLLIIGSVGMAIGAFSVALLAHFGIGGYLPVIAIIVYSAAFMMSWGPICWVLISEIFPNTIRGQAVAIAVAFQWIFNFIVSSTFPPLYDFSPIVAYSLYGTICIVSALFVWKMVPETKGKTLEDMSKLWGRKVADV